MEEEEEGGGVGKEEGEEEEDFGRSRMRTWITSTAGPVLGPNSYPGRLFPKVIFSIAMLTGCIFNPVSLVNYLIVV